VTDATTSETVMVFVMVAVEVMVVVEEVVVSARARSGSMAAESSVEIFIVFADVDRCVDSCVCVRGMNRAFDACAESENSAMRCEKPCARERSR